MENVYELSFADNGRPLIIIRRKPSQIPISIDMELIRLAGHAYMDGPNSIVTYEFLLPERLEKAEKYLQMRQWQKK